MWPVRACGLCVHVACACMWPVHACGLCVHTGMRVGACYPHTLCVPAKGMGYKCVRVHAVRACFVCMLCERDVHIYVCVRSMVCGVCVGTFAARMLCRVHTCQLCPAMLPCRAAPRRAAPRCVACALAARMRTCCLILTCRSSRSGIRETFWVCEATTGFSGACSHKAVLTQSSVNPKQCWHKAVLA